MTGVARIRFAGGGIMLPARSPYDRETLWSALRHALHRRGAVQLDLDGRHWRLSWQQAGECAGCQREAPRYAINGGAGDPLCAACLAARLSLAAAAPAADTAFLAADAPLPGVAAAGGSHSRAPGARQQESSPWHSTSSL